MASLIMHERLEMDTKRAFRVREYTERLISEAVLHGDRHKETMEVKLSCALINPDFKNTT